MYARIFLKNINILFIFNLHIKRTSKKVFTTKRHYIMTTQPCRETDGPLKIEPDTITIVLLNKEPDPITIVLLNKEPDQIII